MAGYFFGRIPDIRLIYNLCRISDFGRISGRCSMYGKLPDIRQTLKISRKSGIRIVSIFGIRPDIETLVPMLICSSSNKFSFTQHFLLKCLHCLPNILENKDYNIHKGEALKWLYKLTLKSFLYDEFYEVFRFFG